jgi:hypothetical protein
MSEVYTIPGVVNDFLGRYETPIKVGIGMLTMATIEHVIIPRARSSITGALDYGFDRAVTKLQQRGVVIGYMQPQQTAMQIQPTQPITQPATQLDPQLIYAGIKSLNEQMEALTKALLEKKV